MSRLSPDPLDVPVQDTEEIINTDQNFETDVAGVKASDFYQHGKDKFPIFDIDKNSFNQNMLYGRKRLRFPSDSTASQYLRGTKYNRTFYIRYTDENGKQYLRKIK